MAQPSVAHYFSSRKRSAVEDNKINSAKKVLVLDSDEITQKRHVPNKLNGNVRENTKTVTDAENGCRLFERDEKGIFTKKIITIANAKPKCTSHKNSNTPKNDKLKKLKSVSSSLPHRSKIEQFVHNMSKKSESEKHTVISERSEIGTHTVTTPPGTPTKITNALDKVKDKPDGPSLKEIRRKLTRSARLAELKASISRFQEGDKKLKEIEKETIKIEESPKLKSFHSLELEVFTSPQKVFSPEKSYLSPKKDSTVRRNLIHQFTPTKNAVAILSEAESPSKQLLEKTSKPALTLPFKYRYLAEFFRCIDTVCQILYNRKETITFRKLKPAVEEMLKRNVSEKHLGQINQIYPGAYTFNQEKLKVYGTGMKSEQWELVIKPVLQNEADHFNSDLLLQRRRTLFQNLLEKTKLYHQEFLSSLDPPILISKDKITRWHPEFDIEKVPDIEESELPQPPHEEKLVSGKEVLDKAMKMFSCNERMEKALLRLKEKKEMEQSVPEEKAKVVENQSVLKGIPKALLERVRQKQAAKALLTMTRSADNEEEIKKYSRLPELARLTRNVFVAEKKSVLPLDTVVEKLGNCYRGRLSKTEMEEHLRLISKEQSNWLVIHNIRNCTYLKIVKNDDISIIINYFENLVKEKSEVPS